MTDNNLLGNQSSPDESLRWPSGQRPGLWPRVLRRTVSTATRVAGRAGRSLILLEYPPSAKPGPRHGHGRPPHPQLLSLLEAGRPRYRDHLNAMSQTLDALRADPKVTDAHWESIWLSGIDAVSLCHFLKERNPRRYVEVGSGMSTKWARGTIDREGLRTEITSIDPMPREEIEVLCDTCVRAPLESADLDVFDDLEAGDIVFMDGSHRVFTNSDATVFMLDILPKLPAGVMVAIHDILLPADYPPEWTGRFYSEQYLLAAFLLGGGGNTRVELPCAFVLDDTELGSTWAETWASAGLQAFPAHGQAFWLTIT